MASTKIKLSLSKEVQSLPPLADRKAFLRHSTHGTGLHNYRTGGYNTSMIIDSLYLPQRLKAILIGVETSTGRVESSEQQPISIDLPALYSAYCTGAERAAQRSVPKVACAFQIVTRCSKLSRDVPMFQNLEKYGRGAARKPGTVLLYEGGKGGRREGEEKKGKGEEKREGRGKREGNLK